MLIIQDGFAIVSEDEVKKPIWDYSHILANAQTATAKDAPKPKTAKAKREDFQLQLF